MPHCFRLWYCIFALLSFSPHTNCEDDENGLPEIHVVKKLSDDILRNYSKHILPTVKLPFNIEITIYHPTLGEIDELEEMLSSVFWISYMWKDESIKWDRNQTNLEWLTLAWNDVWTPVFRVSNPHAEISKAQNVDRTYDTVIYSNDGNAYFSELMTTRTTCGLDMTYYPFDIQKCSISMFENTKFLFNISIELGKYLSRFDKSHGSWTLINQNVTSYYNSLTITFMFKRKPLFLLVNIFLPILVLALLTPVVFILPKRSGERVGYSITMLLAISVYMIIVSDHLPQNSQPMPLISIMILICYILDAFIVFVVIINTKIKAMKDRGRLPYVCRKFVHLTTKLSSCINCGKPNTNYDEHSQEDDDTGFGSGTLIEKEKSIKNSESLTPFGKSNEITWKDLSNAIDKWCFVISYSIKIMLPVIFFSICKTESGNEKLVIDEE